MPVPDSACFHYALQMPHGECTAALRRLTPQQLPTRGHIMHAQVRDPRQVCLEGVRWGGPGEGIAVSDAAVSSDTLVQARWPHSAPHRSLIVLYVVLIMLYIALILHARIFTLRPAGAPRVLHSTAIAKNGKTRRSPMPCRRSLRHANGAIVLAGKAWSSACIIILH